MKRKKPFEAALLRDLLQGRMETQMTLLKLLDRHIEEMRKRAGIDYASTNTYVYTRRSLAEFIKKKFNANNLSFNLLNKRLIQEYQEFSLKDLGYAMQTVRHYWAILKKICKIAYKKGYVKRIYFLHFKLPIQKKSISKSLSRENFEKLKNLKISEKYSSHIFTKDLFLFTCYTVTPYVDTMNITNNNLFTDDEGGLLLKYQRRKNGRLARVKLLPEAILLIEKYKDKLRDTLFPIQRYDVLRANMKGL